MTRANTTVEDRLAVAADVGEFTEAEFEGCGEPVARNFRAAIASGTPLALAARVGMRGSIKFEKRWLSFHADELLAPRHGYVWPASVARGLLRGSDSYADGAASMTWKLLGLATAGHEQASVSWTAPVSDGGSPVSGYVVTPYVGYSPRTSRTFASTATTQVVTGLVNGTQHRFRVQAINAIGTSGFSTVTNPVTPTA